MILEAHSKEGLYYNARGSWSRTQENGRCRVQRFPLRMYEDLRNTGMSVGEKRVRTGHVLVSAEGSNDSGFVGKDDLVVGVGGEEPLEESDGGVEDDRALDTGLHADLDLVVVHEVGADALDVGGGLAVEVGRADEGAEAVRLDLGNITI